MMMHNHSAALRFTAIALTAMAMLGTSFVAGPISPAHAQDASKSVKVEVRTIFAKAEGASVDKNLADLQKTLAKAFKGYGTFKDLGTQDAEVTEGGDAAKFTLPDGTSLQVGFKGRAVEKDKKLVRLGLEVGDKFKSDVRVSEGGRFFQAGLPHDGGILILVITVR